MTNLLKNTKMTDDWNVYEKVNKIEDVKDSVNKFVDRTSNPYIPIWRDYYNGRIKVEELFKLVRGKSLKTVFKRRKEKYPLKPTNETPASMKGWARACNGVQCGNASNKHWLEILMKDIREGKLECEQGKEEQIEELLSEWC